MYLGTFTNSALARLPSGLLDRQPRCSILWSDRWWPWAICHVVPRSRILRWSRIPRACLKSRTCDPCHSYVLARSKPRNRVRDQAHERWRYLSAKNYVNLLKKLKYLALRFCQIFTIFQISLLPPNFPYYFFTLINQKNLGYFDRFFLNNAKVFLFACSTLFITMVIKTSHRK